jgi:hypothetical protein
VASGARLGDTAAHIVAEHGATTFINAGHPHGAAAVVRIQRNHVSLANREVVTLRHSTVSCTVTSGN